MNFTLSLNLNLKNNSDHLQIENLIQDSAQNTNCYNIYNDYELEGTNKYIKKNNKIYIIEYDNIDNLIFFLTFIKTIIKKNRNLYIEYIYNNNSILYASNKYLNNINENNITKNDLLSIIENNKKKIIYEKIYNNL